MRKELYKAIADRLFLIASDGSMIEPSGGTAGSEAEAAVTQQHTERLIKHIDLWNHNVEFLDQEQPWERPAVFVEFTPIVWETIKPGREYRSKPIVNLHIVTDWAGDSSAGSELEDESLEVLDYSGIIHKALHGLEGEHFSRFDLSETHTNHNHEELLESIEVYRCVATREFFAERSGKAERR